VGVKPATLVHFFPLVTVFTQISAVPDRRFSCLFGRRKTAGHNIVGLGGSGQAGIRPAGVYGEGGGEVR
jgi:hypothetical protein